MNRRRALSLRDGLSAAVKATLSRYAEARRMIAAGQFALVYQAVVALSDRSVQNDAFRASPLALVKPLGELLKRLLFEPTESAAVDNLEDASAFLRWLHGLGHAVYLDDFGAGAAAYSYLRRFDVDFVKIDEPFLQAAANGTRERALIRSICVLCKEIGSQVIGEMIEDEAGAGLATALV